MKNNSLLFAGVLLVCFFVSVGVRYQQFEAWKKTPAAYFVGERPMMTTLDAPYWLRWAREYNEGTFGQKGGLRNYPDKTIENEKISTNELSLPLKYTDPTPIYSSSTLSSSSSGTPEISSRDVPLLSLFIALLAPFFNHNYYLAGTMLIPILASLFILPLGIYFFRLGVPLSGLLGGMIGTFASGYYMRSSIGRIDTDMLNLFFPLLASLLILMALRAKTERSVLLYSIGTGLSLFFFQWWYARAGFTLAYFVLLVFSLFIQQIRFRTIMFSALLFVLCVHPGVFMIGSDSVEGFIKDYVTIEEGREVLIANDSNPATFPNTMTTISEVDHVPMEEVLRRVISNPLFDWAGFLAFIALAVLRWRDLLPLAPILALGLLSFQSSNRFIMYLGPFIGIGLGWILSLGIEGIFYFLPRKHADGAWKKWLVAKGAKDTKKKEFQSFKDTKFQTSKWWNWVRQGVLYLGMGVFFWGISSQTAIYFLPGPSIHPQIYASFLEVKKRVPENSALITWWDYGYAITDATGLATFHDGGSQTSPKTYFIARSLISPNAEELYDITQYLSTKSNRGIAKKNTSPEALLQAVRNPQHKPWDPIYLFFTADMTGKYGAISKLGSWDIVSGGSKPRGYRNMACNKITNDEMNCRGATIDLKTGKINKQVNLKRLVFIRGGHVFREQEFGHAQGYTLQLLVAGQQIVEVQLIDEEVFRSNYNQMFLMGRYRNDLFEETFNASPLSRLFRIKY